MRVLIERTKLSKPKNKAKIKVKRETIGFTPIHLPVKEFRLLIQENKFVVAYGALATFTFFLFFIGTISLYFEVW